MRMLVNTVGAFEMADLLSWTHHSGNALRILISMLSMDLHQMEYF